MRDCGLDHDADDGRISDPSRGSSPPDWADDLAGIIGIVCVCVFIVLALGLFVKACG